MLAALARSCADPYSGSAVPPWKDSILYDQPRSRFFESVSALVERRRVGNFDAARTSYLQKAVNTDVSFVSCEDAFIVLQVSGAVHVKQAGVHTDAGIGTVLLLDSDQPCHLSSTGRIVQLIIRVPAATMDFCAPGWRERVACALPRNISTMIAAVVRSAFEQVFDPTPAQAKAASEALLGLVAAAVEEDAEDSLPSLLPHVVRRIQDTLLARLGDERLDPAAVAREHGVSERQLQRLFHDAGTSFCRWIKQARLDHCAADLSNPDLHDRSITEISFGWGFNDAAHFSRTFRSEFGMTPRAYRNGALHMKVNGKSGAAH